MPTLYVPPPEEIPQAEPPPQGEAHPGKVHKEILARIDQYAELIAQVAQEAQVDPAEIKGFIAAETGGKALSVSSSGYRGLMQSSRDAEDDQPEVSLRKGAKKLREFRASLARLLKPLGLDFTALNRWTQLGWLARAYNAGPGTVQKAVEYAGDPARWQDAEPYQRALLHHGAYSTRPYAPAGEEGGAEKWRIKLRHRNLTLDQAREEGMPAHIERAISKKWEHTAGYASRVITYAQHYA